MRHSREPHAATTFRLLTLGGLALVDSAGNVTGQQRRRLALLALLASARERGVSRDRLMAWLSPESPVESARHSLHQLIYYLRQQTSEDVFLGTDPLQLNPAVLSSDRAEFEAAIDRGDLAQAVELYRGPFLDGFHLTSVEFEEWTAAERSHLAAKYRDALARLAAEAQLAGDHAAAIDWWRQLTTVDPLNARAALGLMTALVDAGDAPGALRHAQVHADFVHRELGGETDAQVSAFVRRLQSARPDSSDPTPADGEVVRHDAVRLQPVKAGPPATATWHGPGRRRVVGAAIVGLALVASAWSVYRTRSGAVKVVATGRLVASDEVIVGDMTAPPGDSLVARALTELLRTSLRAASVRVVAQTDMDRGLQRMRLPVTTPVDALIARELAVRNGHEAILTTNLAPVGHGFLVNARLTTVTGQELATAMGSAATADELIVVVGRLATALRTAAGDSLQSRLTMDPLEPVSTHSLRALTLYTQAQDASNVLRGRPQQSPEMLAMLREALAIDSTFAMAHRRLGAALFNLGYTRDALAELRAAERFSDKLTEVERLAVLLALHFNLREHTRATADAKALLRLEPGNLMARNWLVNNYMISGQYDVAEREIPAIAPIGIIPFWPNLREYQGRGAEALDSARAFHRAAQDSTDGPWMRAARDRLAVFHAVRFSYDSAVLYALPRPSAERGSPMIIAAIQFARGQLARATVTQEHRALTADVELLGSPRTTADSYTALATLLISGDRVSANRRLDAARADTTYRNRSPADRHIRPILALALAGRSAEARRELAAMEEASSADLRIARETDLALARGAVALAEGRSGDAIAAFRRASGTVTLASYDACRVCALPWLGRAYEAAGQPDSAAAVYERYLSTGDPYRVMADGAWRAVTLRRLGTLHAELGDTALATRRLAELVELWKDADPELVPQVEDARHKLAKLRRGR